MKWYHLLITDEFIDYFCNGSNIYYTDFKNKWEYIPQPLFKKFIDTVTGITYAFARCGNSSELFLSTKEKEPDIYNAYINCKKTMPPVITLADIWQSIKVNKNCSPYQVDVKYLSAEQIAVLILYPFWSRMGGSWEIDFLDSGRLKQYLIELKEKSEQ
ncbi:MAG: hypothetical protein IJF58_05550 [Clostridia bacterium]|nr:hypothetical protein [Clostridia bacterium]